MDGRFNLMAARTGAEFVLLDATTTYSYTRQKNREECSRHLDVSHEDRGAAMPGQWHYVKNECMIALILLCCRSPSVVLKS